MDMEASVELVRQHLKQVKVPTAYDKVEMMNNVVYGGVHDGQWQTRLQ